MRTKRTTSIGVFDSGFGGLAILKEIVKKLPNYSYVYFGDTARAPYGDRSMDSVYKFTKQAVDFLFKHDCELVILACNTASAEALRKIQQHYLPKKYPKRRVLGVIVPALEEAAIKTKNNRIGVLATTGTVHSGTFPRELHLRNPKIKIFQQATPLLVPIVENGMHRDISTQLILKRYLAPLLKKNIDTLILGCTHYEHLELEIKKIIGKKIRIISEGKVVARKLKEYLSRHPEIESRLLFRKKRTFYTTDLSDKFCTLGSEFFGSHITPQKTILK